MEEKKKKKPGRPVKYVYLDKYERTTKDIEQRIDALANQFLAHQKINTRIQLAIVAILCVGILLELVLK
jgi:hypothetical protein